MVGHFIEAWRIPNKIPGMKAPNSAIGRHRAELGAKGRAGCRPGSGCLMSGGAHSTELRRLEDALGSK